MHRRGATLLMIITIAIVAVACGRATEDEINQALGITPTPTPSADDLATATANALATEEAREMALASPEGDAAALALGNVSRGRTQFLTTCMGCHGPASQQGPKLTQPGGPGQDVTLDQMVAVLRNGEGHPTPPGPFPPSRLADSAIVDLTAYILAEANK